MARRKNTIDKAKEALVRRGDKGTRLTKADDMLCYQTSIALGNNAEAARRLGITERTLYRALARVENANPPAKLEAMRKEAIGALDTAITDQTHRILESITDDDLKSGRIEERNSKGEIVGYKYYGPSLLQKATSIGILTDKKKVLRDMQVAVQGDAGTGALMMPETADQLLKAIVTRAKSIQILKADFREDAPDLATRVDQVMEVAAEVSTTGDDDAGNDQFPFDPA